MALRARTIAPGVNHDQYRSMIGVLPMFSDMRSTAVTTSLLASVWFGAIGICGLGGHSLAASEPTAKRILLLTGEDYPGHKWRETTPVLRRQLAQDPRLDVQVVEDLRFLRSPELHSFAAIVLHFKNYDPQVPGPEGQENLARFVHTGGGAVLVHFACGAFQEWPEFVRIAGRVWDPRLRGHDPHGTFRVEIADPRHPITQGLAAFEVTDELYTCLVGQTPITTLATAVSSVDHRTYPMAFVLQYGRGRVFHSPLGHDVEALSNPTVGQLFRRAAAWVAGLDPSVDHAP